MHRDATGGRRRHGRDGIDSHREQRRGRVKDGFLEEQLRTSDEHLPEPVAQQIAQLSIGHVDAERLFIGIALKQKRINALPDGPDKQAARQKLNDQGNQAAYEARRRELLRAIYSPAQLKEQMVWFWLNHFSVFEQKANVRWMLSDYSNQAIRPHACAATPAPRRRIKAMAGL